MAKMGVSKQSLEGKPPIPAGMYDFRLDGFKPKVAKKGDSINLNPILKIINNPNGQNDNTIFFNLNNQAGWIFKDFAHAMGFELVPNTEGGGDLPGDFVPDPSDPENVEKYKYQGPMLGRNGRCEVGVRKDDKNKDQSYIKAFFCSVPGCLEKHSTDLK
jgi:hypothetical protein